MPMTRRQFLKRAGLATAGTVLGPSLFANPFVRKAFAETIGDRYLVVLFLHGGNDGQNTIIPYDDPGSLRSAYDVYRDLGGGGLNVAPGDLALPSNGFLDPNTGTQLGFHPGLSDLRDMYDAGRVAVLQGCGYPDYSLSHDESTTIWQTANPLGLPLLASTGWAGRHLAVEYGATDIPAVTIAYSVAGELKQNATSVLAVKRLNRFDFPVDDYDTNDEAALKTAFQNLYAEALLSAQSTKYFIGGAGTATYESTQSYPEAHTAYVGDLTRQPFHDAYGALGTSTARDLREIAKIIYGVSNDLPGVGARFFQLTNGGYDTHADQGGAETNGQHYGLHKEIGQALKLFYDDLDDMGVGNKVLTVVWSEFSRRIPQNSNGTDHGSQGPMFVIGHSSTVNGGAYGAHPNINDLDDNGNTKYSQVGSFRSTDFRDVYGTILKNWVNMGSNATIKSTVLPLDPGPAADYWTVENFDMGFI
jgi:uncharacterized protein (DUF1501 family)